MGKSCRTLDQESKKVTNGFYHAWGRFTKKMSVLMQSRISQGPKDDGIITQDTSKYMGRKSPYMKLALDYEATRHDRIANRFNFRLQKFCGVAAISYC